MVKKRQFPPRKPVKPPLDSVIYVYPYPFVVEKLSAFARAAQKLD
jgi:hypothetical protein